MEVLDPLDPLGPQGPVFGHRSVDALAAACQIVAALYRSPSEGLRDDLESGRLRAVSDALARYAGLDAPQGPHAPPPFDTLGPVYVALFVSRAGGVAAPPYVGLVRDRQLMGPSVTRLRSDLEALGLRISPEWRELPDHLAAVAEAVELLLERGRVGAGMALAANYLSPWFARYADAVAEADASGFYGEMSRFLRTVLKEVAPRP
jgi:putative dimethyl sulfoxide reductase chaperone